MLTIGLTGGIASGKTRVAGLFATLGAAVVDTDVIAREVVAPGEPGLDQLRTLFGPSIITDSGELDRRGLRAIVFADTAKRQALESVLHPLIRGRTLEKLAEVREPYAIAVIPLLIETNFREIVDRVLVVDCPVEIQLARLTRRDDLTDDEAHAMIAAQSDRASRLAAADDVIDNSGSIRATRAQVEGLHQRYLELAAA